MIFNYAFCIRIVIYIHVILNLCISFASHGTAVLQFDRMLYLLHISATQTVYNRWAMEVQQVEHAVQSTHYQFVTTLRQRCAFLIAVLRKKSYTITVTNAEKKVAACLTQYFK